MSRLRPFSFRPWGLPLTWILLAGLAGCKSDPVSPGATTDSTPDSIADSTAGAIGANVIAVSVRGTEGAWTFAVTVASPDSGCSQYADWWEVVGADGSLAYRRVLLHSHVTEQPFVRTGGPVPVAAGDSILIRAHMNTSGYGGQVFRGTIAGMLAPVDETPALAPELASVEPLPQNCAF